MHFEAMGQALQALSPFDQYSWDKNFAVVQLLNEYNWVHCHNNEELSELLQKDANSWGAFWEQENAEEIMDHNSELFKEEVDCTVEEILTAWELGDAVTAG